MAPDTDDKRQGNISDCILAFYGLWCCVLLLATLFVSLLFAGGPVIADEYCQYSFSFRDVVGLVLIGGSFLTAVFAGYRAGRFVSRLMVRSSVLRRVWGDVLGLGAALTASVVATGVLLSLWGGLFWLIGSWDFMSPVCEVVPGG